MAKLTWERKSDTYEIAWLGNGIDASCLSVDAAYDPSKGVRWCVWHDGGYEPTMDEAKAACEAKASSRLRDALRGLDNGLSDLQRQSLTLIHRKLTKLRDKWYAKADEHLRKPGGGDLPRHNATHMCANDLTEALDWIEILTEP